MDVRKQREEAKVIGQRLANARIARGLTQQDVAKKAGVTRVLITYLENGDRAPSVFLLMSLLNVLHITPQYLLWGMTEGLDAELRATLRELNHIEMTALQRRASNPGRTGRSHRTGEAPHRRRAS